MNNYQRDNNISYKQNINRNWQIQIAYKVKTIFNRDLPLKTSTWGQAFSKLLKNSKYVVISTTYKKADKNIISTEYLKLDLILDKVIIAELKQSFSNIQIFERVTGYEFLNKKGLVFRNYILGYKLENEFITLLKLLYDGSVIEPLQR